MKDSPRKKLKKLLKNAAKHGRRHTLDRIQPVLSRLTRPLTTTALDPYWSWRSMYRC